MARGLDTLIRYHRWQLDGLRREMAGLQEARAKVQAAIDGVDQSIAHESASLTPEMAVTFNMGLFVDGQLKRRHQFEGQRARLDEEIIQLNDRIAAAFEEIKRFEIVRDRRAEEAAKAERQAEETFYNEVAGMRADRARREEGE